MPTLFLSPSTQDWNMYVTGSGSEEYNMNLLADALVPYLNSNGIRYRRNDPDGTAADAIRLGNAGSYDLYLALHSNAAPEGHYGEERGIIAFYYPGSVQGQRAADLIAEELRTVYPLPDLVSTRPTTALGEVRQPRAPAVLVEIGYHDNYADEAWLKNNLDSIAQNLVRSLCDYFGIPFIPAGPVRWGTVATDGTGLNIRSYPSLSGTILGSMPNGAQVTINGETDGWFVVAYNGITGYASSKFIIY